MLRELAAMFFDDAPLLIGTVFVLGLLIGSFLNVVIHRLPIILERDWREQASEWVAASDTPPASTAPAGTAPVSTTPNDYSLISPRSACPACGVPIRAWQNIPIVSWIALRGRCASCGARISLRYPLIELATGVTSAIIAWHFGLGWPLACALLVTWALIALTGIDIDHQLLPDDLTLPLLWAGLVASVLIGPTFTAGTGAATLASLPVTPAESIIGAAAGYSSLWLVYHAFRLVTGKEGMGYGDFKLFAALGAWFGWKMLPLIILLSAASGAVLGVAMIVFRGRDRAQPMPFGPYLAIAGWLAMLYGDSLLTGYLRVSGITR